MEFSKCLIKKPVQKGDIVYVLDSDNKIIEKHLTIDLSKRFFTMTNDAFYDYYGFNFVPEGEYWEQAKKAVGKM